MHIYLFVYLFVDFFLDFFLDVCIYICIDLFVYCFMCCFLSWFMYAFVDLCVCVFMCGCVCVFMRNHNCGFVALCVYGFVVLRNCVKTLSSLSVPFVIEVLNTISLIISLVEPMLVPVNTVPSSKIRNAFICSPFPFVKIFFLKRKALMESFFQSALFLKL